MRPDAGAPARAQPRRGRTVAMSRLPRLPAVCIGLLAAALVSGCGPAGEDVRIGYCKRLLVSQLPSLGLSDAGYRWIAADAEPRGYEHLRVALRLEAADAQGEMTPAHGVCFYDYDAVDDTAMTLADPLSAYSTSPSRMTVNGKALSRALLTRAKREALR
jgi:hypothetical protein